MSANEWAWNRENILLDCSCLAWRSSRLQRNESTQNLLSTSYAGLLVRLRLLLQAVGSNVLVGTLVHSLFSMHPKDVLSLSRHNQVLMRTGMDHLVRGLIASIFLHITLYPALRDWTTPNVLSTTLCLLLVRLPYNHIRHSRLSTWHSSVDGLCLNDVHLRYGMMRTRGRDCVILPVAQGSGHLHSDKGSTVSSAPTPLPQHCTCNLPTTFSTRHSS